MAPISVSVQHHDPPVGVVTLIGEHDGFTAPRLGNELAVLIDGAFGVVVDLRDATFIDSENLSVLLAARLQAEEADVGFGLVLREDDYTQVDRLLELTGLGSAFALFATIDEASAAVRAGYAGSSGRASTR
jgi:anti-anti-sigma factor